MCKVNYKNIKSRLIEEGYTLLNEEVNFNKDNLHLTCPMSHEYSVSYSNFFSNKRRCFKCKRYENGLINFEDFRLILKEEDYTIMEDLKSIVKKDKCNVKCPFGHDWKVSFTDFSSGVRCAKCSGNVRLTQSEVDERYNKEGYKLISKYRNSQSNIIAICPNGHEWEHIHLNFLKGNRCCYCCTTNIKYTLAEVKEIFLSKGFIPTFTEYKGNKHQLTFVCSKHLDYGEQYCSLHNLQRGLANCQICYRNKFIGENSSRWTGGHKDIALSIREFLYSKWTLPSLEYYGFKCVLSGETRNLEVHHVNKSFHVILSESLRELGFHGKRKLSDYTLEERCLLNNLILDKHNINGFGVPLEKKVHKLFHKLYGIKNNTYEQFDEFSKRYKNNEFSN